jgi:hypothetical protein
VGDLLKSLPQTSRELLRFTTGKPDIMLRCAHMRALIATLVCAIAVLPACKKGENAGAEEAKREADKLQKEKESKGEVAKKISPPVPGEKKVPCEQLIGDVSAYGTAMGELDPMTIKDVQKEEPEAAATCALVRGGKRPTEAEQQALLKKNGKLGVIPGDTVCQISAFCWTIEDADRFRTKCKTRKDADDDSMGSYACRQTVAVGAADVFVYRFFDADTKCILQVKGGPSQTDNEAIRKCAVTARDSIGPAQISVTGAPAPAPAADGAGSGSAESK